eukprot:CAMPEP_0194521892 /NCGR_PEP_ID=MMETSP0253-20130528/56324_1 /TAXON_ID=2966 /ORGANISM="Noctiluca scintillans" /LENGTH=459 /DNA_ID=CAMNT_0039366279 /DNA_START=56 /DNA_END=1435 /DNA_ORIENTATION=-
MTPPPSTVLGKSADPDETTSEVVEVSTENGDTTWNARFKGCRCLRARRRRGREKIPSDEEPEDAKLGDFETFVTLGKAFFGLSILAEPYAFRTSGYLGGPIVFVLVGIITNSCIQGLLEVAAQIGDGSVTYPDIAEKVGGPRCRILVEALLYVMNVGIGIVYIAFILNNTQEVLCEEGIACWSKGKLFACVGVLMLPLVLLKTIKLLTIPNMLSNVMLLGGVGWATYCCIEELGEERDTTAFKAIDVRGQLLYFGLAVESMEGIPLILPIRCAMRHPERLPLQLAVVVSVVVTLLTSFGLLGYYAYGDRAEPTITFSLPQTPPTSLMRIAYCIGLMFSYAIFLHPVHEMNEGTCDCLKGPGRWPQKTLVRMFVFVVSGAIAMSLPNFTFFMEVLGSVAGSMLSFVLPAYFHLRRPDKTQGTRLGTARDYFHLIFGVVVGIVSSGLSLKQLFLAFTTSAV